MDQAIRVYGTGRFAKESISFEADKNYYYQIMMNLNDSLKGVNIVFDRMIVIKPLLDI